MSATAKVGLKAAGDGLGRKTMTAEAKEPADFTPCRTAPASRNRPKPSARFRRPWREEINANRYSRARRPICSPACEPESGRTGTPFAKAGAYDRAAAHAQYLFPLASCCPD